MLIACYFWMLCVSIICMSGSLFRVALTSLGVTCQARQTSPAIIKECIFFLSLAVFVESDVHFCGSTPDTEACTACSIPFSALRNDALMTPRTREQRLSKHVTGRHRALVSTIQLRVVYHSPYNVQHNRPHSRPQCLSRP